MHAISTMNKIQIPIGCLFLQNLDRSIFYPPIITVIQTCLHIDILLTTIRYVQRQNSSGCQPLLLYVLCYVLSSYILP